VQGTDAHLPRVDAGELTPEALRRRFAAPHDWQPRSAATTAPSRRAPAAASVLVPLVQRDDGMHVLLTQRTDHLHDHAGQISFPGGRWEPRDPDEVATALRETRRRSASRAATSK